MAKKLVALTRFLGRLRGASQPILAETSDGHTMVVKFGTCLEGPHLLFNEAMGAELYAAAGLPGPGWTLALAGEAFLANYPECWPLVGSQPVCPPASVVFAANYVHAGAARVMQILPGSSLSRVEQREEFWLAWLIDVCAQHTDHRQALFVEQQNRCLRPVFIDHGQMFGGPAGDFEPRFRASRFLDARLYAQPALGLKERLLNRIEAIDGEKLRRRSELLPESWQTPLAAGRLNACLSRLAQRSLLANTLDTLLQDCEHEDQLNRQLDRIPVRLERDTTARDACGGGPDSLRMEA